MVQPGRFCILREEYIVETPAGKITRNPLPHLMVCHKPVTYGYIPGRIYGKKRKQIKVSDINQAQKPYNSVIGSLRISEMINFATIL